MGDHTAFFYGTLMAPAVLYRVIYGTPQPEAWQKNLTTFQPAILPAYRRHRVKHADYPAIVPASTTTNGEEKISASVRGSFVTGLTDGDLWRLDIFEGSQYIRKKVRIRVLSSSLSLDQLAPTSQSELDAQTVKEAEAETYIFVSDPSELDPNEWDFEEFKRERMRAWTGEEEVEGVEEDEGFADVERAVKQQAQKEMNGNAHDPTGGRGKGGWITEQLAGLRNN